VQAIFLCCCAKRKTLSKIIDTTYVHYMTTDTFSAQDCFSCKSMPIIVQLHMERYYFFQEQQPGKNDVFDNRPDAKEKTEATENNAEKLAEAIELELRFEQIQEDLRVMFGVTVTSEVSLRYPWVKDELYAKVVEGLEDNAYFALDYMVHEEVDPKIKTGLLSRNDLIARGIRNYQDKGRTILHTWKPPRRNYIEDLFLEAGMFTKEELEHERQNYPKQHA
jgi:hypothetical protein